MKGNCEKFFLTLSTKLKIKIIESLRERKEKIGVSGGRNLLRRRKEKGKRVNQSKELGLKECHMLAFIPLIIP